MKQYLIFCKAKDLGNIAKIIVFIRHGIGAVHEIGEIYWRG